MTNQASGLDGWNQEDEEKGILNSNADCWNVGQCGYDGPNGRDGQGPCEFCGPEGYCCKKESAGWWDKTNGCDGTIGGEAGHRCVNKPGIIVISFSCPYLSRFHHRL